MMISEYLVRTSYFHRMFLISTFLRIMKKLRTRQRQVGRHESRGYLRICIRNRSLIERLEMAWRVLVERRGRIERERERDIIDRNKGRERERAAARAVPAIRFPFQTRWLRGVRRARKLCLHAPIRQRDGGMEGPEGERKSRDKSPPHFYCTQLRGDISRLSRPVYVSRVRITPGDNRSLYLA